MDSHERIAHFEILDELAPAAPFRIYRANDPASGNTVALTVLRDAGRVDLDAVAARARSIQQLSHPGLAQVLDIIAIPGVGLNFVTTQQPAASVNRAPSIMAPQSASAPPTASSPTLQATPPGRASFKLSVSAGETPLTNGAKLRPDQMASANLAASIELASGTVSDDAEITIEWLVNGVIDSSTHYKGQQLAGDQINAPFDQPLFAGDYLVRLLVNGKKSQTVAFKITE